MSTTNPTFRHAFPVTFESVAGKLRDSALRDPLLDFGDLEDRHGATLIVIHSQQGSQSLHAEHQACIDTRHWSGLGYNFWIERSLEERTPATIWRGRPLWAVAAHCIGANKNSYGICLAGDARKLGPTPSQMWALVDLIHSLFVSSPNLLLWCFHRDILTADTDCPGSCLAEPEVTAAMSLYQFPPTKYGPLVFPAQFRPCKTAVY